MIMKPLYTLGNRELPGSYNCDQYEYDYQEKNEMPGIGDVITVESIRKIVRDELGVGQMDPEKLKQFYKDKQLYGQTEAIRKQQEREGLLPRTEDFSEFAKPIGGKNMVEAQSRYSIIEKITGEINVFTERKTELEANLASMDTTTKRSVEEKNREIKRIQEDAELRKADIQRKIKAFDDQIKENKMAIDAIQKVSKEATRGE